MCRIIGQYEIYRRTEYSKLNVRTPDGSEISKKISEKILSDYNEQIKNPDKYFKIINGIHLEKVNVDNAIKFLFIPEGINKIRNNALEGGCFNYISIPSSVRVIGDLAFSGCNKLLEINLPDTIESLGSCIFKKCSRIKNIILPKHLEEIPFHAFEGCTRLENIILPDSVQHISSFAFNHCHALKKINIPKDINRFGQFPFYDSNIHTLIFNHDVPKNINPKENYGYLLHESRIDTIEISDNISFIDPNFFKYADTRFIEKIEYLGSDEALKKFKEDNKSFLETFKNAKIVSKENIDIIIGKNSGNILEGRMLNAQDDRSI